MRFLCPYCGETYPNDGPVPLCCGEVHSTLVEVDKNGDVIEEEEDDRTCTNCMGSGEGMHDGTHCIMCGGSGVDKPRKERDE